MPAIYEKLGIRFFYPDNWELDESEVLDGNNTVSVYSPGGAFWSIIMHPPGLEPEDLVDAALEAMHQEYDEVDAEPFHDVVGGREVHGSDLNFYCFDLTNTALIRALATQHGTYLVLCQADDHEFERVGAVFEAMTSSLLNPSAKMSSFVKSTSPSHAGTHGDD
ncbi:MAG TPA: hypothetical protein VHV77_04290 [Pirellulales bacterium]|nr:hypothetical protein [Pirellulales bacterium]